jgi:hypothetical protein
MGFYEDLTLKLQKAYEGDYDGQELECAIADHELNLSEMNSIQKILDEDLPKHMALVDGETNSK